MCMAIAGLFAASAGAQMSDVQPVSAALSKALQAQRATKMGIDSTDVLWGWDARLQSVTFTPPTGVPTRTLKIPNARGVAADSVFGILTLTSDGKGVQKVAKDGTAALAATLDEPASDIAWLDASSFLVTPMHGVSRVESWDLVTGTRLLRMGSEPEVVARPGLVRHRTVQVQYRPATKEIFTFDTFLGDLQVFNAQGRATRRAGTVHWHLHASQAEMDRRDKEAAAAGRKETYSMNLWPSFSIDRGGSVWLADKSGDGSVSAVILAANGTTRRETLSGIPCTALTFVLWRDWFVTFRDPGMLSREPCTSVMELRRLRP